MISITESIYNLALRLGVEFYFDTPVSEIIIESNKVKGIIAKNSFIDSDIVISNMDIYYTYNKLLPDIKKPKIILKQERSSSAVIFYWGIASTFKDLDLHNIFFSNDYKKEFESIFRDKKVFDDPTIYVNITSKDIKGDAPKGCENWFVMINTPADHGQNWDEIVERLKNIVIEKISKSLVFHYVIKLFVNKF